MNRKLSIIIGVVIVAIVAVALFFNSGDSSNSVLSGSLGKEKACAIANAYLKTNPYGGFGSINPQSPDKDCKNFNQSGNSAVICVGGKTVVALQRYQEEGWKAYDIMLGAGCQ
jgi:hypothetical protein